MRFLDGGIEMTYIEAFAEQKNEYLQTTTLWPIMTGADWLEEMKHTRGEKKGQYTEDAHELCVMRGDSIYNDEGTLVYKTVLVKVART